MTMYVLFCRIFVLVFLLLFSGCASEPVLRKDTLKPVPPPVESMMEEPLPTETAVRRQTVYRNTGIVYPLVPVRSGEIVLTGDDLDMASLQLAIERSLAYYDRLSPGLQYRIGSTLYSVQDLKESLLLFLRICLNSASIGERDEKIRENFDIYQATHGEPGKVVFTGYYEPELRGSMERTEQYRHPIYRVPDDAVVVSLGKFFPKYKGERIIGRLEDGELLPYPARAEIDGEGCLAGKGLEIVWVDDPVELFYLHIQGSGKIILPDGTEIRINYAQSNGRAFKGASSCLLRSGKITSSQMSLRYVKRYLQEHPEDLDLLHKNESYIFFKIVPEGPLGSLNVPLTAGRSLAADPAIFPKGGLVFIRARKPILNEKGNLLSWQPFGRFALLQDAGGMIKGPGRIDIFCGSGKGAEHIAGSIKEKGSLYFLIKKPEAVKAMEPAR
ncbi:MAG: transglycosylase [Deltaproteobacteria bacterium]|nr:transglycosylase [Deltaproteobacteria bacterium]